MKLVCYCNGKHALKVVMYRYFTNLPGLILALNLSEN